MLLIQQSSSFRAWTSRALMVYFRRALLFLVVDPRQNLQHNYCLSSPPTIGLDDLEDNEKTWITHGRETSIDFSDRKEKNLEQIPLRRCVSRECLFRRFSQGLNNSMTKSKAKEPQNSSLLESIEEFSSKDLLTSTASTTDQLSHVFNNPLQALLTEQVEVFSTIDPNQSLRSIPRTLAGETNTPKSKTQNPVDALSTHLNCMNSILSVYPVSLRTDKGTQKTLCSSLLQPCSHCSLSFSTSSSPDDDDDIYEKYQTSFSHFLHRTKSLRTICEEDRLQSMLVLEPNTSIITVYQLTYHPCGRNPIIHPTTSTVCLRLIADRIDSSIQCDAMPVGCRKSSNKKLQATSFLIDLPHKTLYIDS